MENIKEIITIASAIFGLVATITGFLIPLVKNVKAKKYLTAINKLTTNLQSLVIEAEQFVNYSGPQKKDYVMTKAEQFAIANKIPFDKESVSNQIEEIVELTKKVNQRESDSQDIVDDL